MTLKIRLPATLLARSPTSLLFSSLSPSRGTRSSVYKTSTCGRLIARRVLFARDLGYT
jgi:hypothetical protein